MDECRRLFVLIVMTRSRRAFLRALALASAGACASTAGSGLAYAAAAGRPRPARAAASRYDRLRTVRVAPGAVTDALMRRQAREGYNAVMLNDLAGWNEGERRWERAGAATIAQQLELAREYGFSVLVQLPAAVPLPPAMAGEANGLSRLTDSELRERIALWSHYERDEIAGIFFVTDDPFYLGIAAGDLGRWSAISRETAPELPILGMAGEFALPMTPQERGLHWDPASIDGLLLLNYPYNLGAVWGHPLDHSRGPDPDGALASYELAYVAAMQEALLKDLQPHQIVVPVIQTFFYEGDAEGSVPRPRDIEIQSWLLHAAMRDVLGQKDNFAMGYYFAGPDGLPYPFAIPHGLYDVPSWSQTAAKQNTWLEAERVASLLPQARHRAAKGNR
jgi:hypothetical protein